MVGSHRSLFCSDSREPRFASSVLKSPRNGKYVCTGCPRRDMLRGVDNTIYKVMKQTKRKSLQSWPHSVLRL
jgi:hypothetical protein